MTKELAEQIQVMEACLERALQGEVIEGPPPFFERGAELLHRVASTGEGREECLFLFSAVLAAVEQMVGVIAFVSPDKVILACAETVDASKVAEAQEKLLWQIRTCNPYCKKERCIPRDLAEVFVKTGWDDELFQFVATVKAKIADLIQMASCSFDIPIDAIPGLRDV